MSFILNEKLAPSVVIYMITKRLIRDWTEWDAYKSGIISEEGHRLKAPVSSEERQSWDILDRYCWNSRRLVTKFIGEDRFAFTLATAFLMNEESTTIVLRNLDKYRPEFDGLTAVKQKQLFDCLKEMAASSIVSESHLDLETNAMKIYRQMVPLIEKYKLKSLFEDGEPCSSTTLGDISQQTPVIGNKKPLKRIRKPIRNIKIRRSKEP